jgi:putative phosphoesterase
MRIAALYDIHGNLPALDAVLADVAVEQPNLILVGGDVVGGPMPAETLARLRSLDTPQRYVRGNDDREVVEAASRQRAPEGEDELIHAWVAEQLSAHDLSELAAYEDTVTAAVDGLGDVLFCHGTPDSDSDVITRVTAPERLSRLVAGVDAQVVVCGHTHQQFRLESEGVSVVNAGAVGMPYEGRPGAFWAMIGPEIELRATMYDIEQAVAQMRVSGFPNIDERMLLESLIEPVDPGEAADFLERHAAS